MKYPYKIIFIIFFIVLFAGCIRQPSAPVYNQTLAPATNGAYILCEGIWGSDNSSLDRYDFYSKSITNNFYNLANPGLRLGDLAEDIVIWKSTAFITVTTAKTIEVIDVFTGKSKGRIK